ncbi:SAM-dependent methyltransferase [Actinocorallia populi]|uniref:SAM-dependent methyltransferase n=1 Tax=Actinocorallia populi TaxID=2079200 RepID=UPI0018E593FC|nr:SAM-dependent methyltransferase [Actinocorallia populi]
MSDSGSEWDFTSISSDRAPVNIDTTVAHPARMYDYYLGGKDNFAADRAAADAAMAAAPGMELTARMNRAFLGRAVRFLAESGIKQIIDIGTGIPTAGNTHQVAQEVDPQIRVVYIDNDPMVLIHARALMETQSQGTTTVIQADLREPEAILAHPQVRSLIDFTRPIAVNLVAILHFIKDEENPREILKTLREALPKGSYLVVSHCTLDFTPPEIGAALREIYNKATAPLVPRTHAEILEYFEGFELVEPGLVLPPLWHPDRIVSQEEAENAHFYAGVGRLL